MVFARVVICAAMLSASSSIGWTCCLAYPARSPMSLVGEKAVIVWDADNKVEHFVRQAAFDGSAKDFGFIVPAPTEPKVVEADDQVFAALETFVQEQTARRNLEGAAASATDATTGVELIDQYRVGDYEVSILKATDGGSMLGWLKANGYSNRPAMTDWLDHYAKMGWYFAALKFVREKDADSPETKAVRVSFATDVPFYPYKMPDDTWPKGHFRPISLYFVSTGVARGQYRGDSKDWEAEVVWSGPLTERAAAAVSSSLGLAPEDVPAGSVLTAFHNTENAQGYDKDLFFLTYTSLLPTWAFAGLIAAFVAFVAWLLFSRKKVASQKG